METEFVQDEKVIVHNLGDGKEYRAIIKGVSIQYHPNGSIMIVEMIDNFRGDDYKFDTATISQYCLKKA